MAAQGLGAATEAQGDELRVLGPIAIVGAPDATVAVARKHRQLLGALICTRGRVVPADALIDDLWHARPPASAPKLLQVYVSQLRRQLPAAATIRTRGAGYALEVADEHVDAGRFERLLRDGQRALQVGDPIHGSTLLRRALALWRGRAYGDVADDLLVRPDARRLEELRRAAVEDRFDADLALGQHRLVLGELRSLAAEHPLRERVQAQTMLALYRCGHQDEALALYRSTRQRLVDELGVEPRPELQDLHQRILRHDASLSVAPAPGAPAALPVPATPLLGRDRELADLGALLRRSDVRLLVLTGAGGSGKTRLAIEAARDAAARFAGGAAFLPLESVRDPMSLAGAIAAGLGMQTRQREPFDDLVDQLRDRELLLVLDNMEQLRAAGSLLVELLARAPRLTLLVTSRVVLRLSGEWVYAVEPLASDGATALLMQRARQADPRFAPTPDEQETLQQIGRRLDGLPLAIELAAGHLRALTPRELLDHLDRQLPLTNTGPRDLPARQRTLHATAAWSLDQLRSPLRHLLRRLTVFRGGCTLDAAAGVCGASADDLAELVDHSLLARRATAYGSRFFLLETIREFAADRLLAGTEADDLRRRHAHHALRTAETLGLSIEALHTATPQRLDLARLEQDNMRAALDWALDRDPLLGLRLMVALEQFWMTTRPHECRQRLDALLAASTDLPPDLHARALRDLGGTYEMSGESEAALACYEQSRALFDELGDEAASLHLQHRLAQVAVVEGDSVRARRLAEPALAVARTRGWAFEEAVLLSVLALAAATDGDVEAAYVLRRESYESCRRVRHWAWGETNQLRRMAELATQLGRRDEAREHLRDALEVSLEVRDPRRTVPVLATAAAVALDDHDEDSAGRLWGAIEAAEQRSPFRLWLAHDQLAYEARVGACTSADFHRGRLLGQAMPLDEAVAFAVQTVAARTRSPSRVVPFPRAG